MRLSHLLVIALGVYVAVSILRKVAETGVPASLEAVTAAYTPFAYGPLATAMEPGAGTVLREPAL